QHVIEYRLHQIHSFLRYQPRDQAEERNFGVLPESEGPLQIGFAGALPGQVPRSIVRGNPPIRPRIPDIVIGAVQYADEAGRARLEHSLQPEAILGRLYLIAIGGAHGGDGVRKSQPTLAKVDLAVKLEMARAKQTLVQAHQSPISGRKQSLVSLVMDGEDGSQGGQP